MTSSDSSGENPAGPKKPGQTMRPGSREARLAAALRENLRRRKVQERARVSGQAAQGEPETAGKGGQTPQNGENR